MAYIGAKPVNGFFEKQQLTTDGSTTTFALNTTIGSTSAILVVKDGVVQEPEEAYTLGGGGTSITFTAAPASTDTTYVHFLGQAVVQNLTDVNGVEFILDADADAELRTTLASKLALTSTLSKMSQVICKPNTVEIPLIAVKTF